MVLLCCNHITFVKRMFRSLSTCFKSQIQFKCNAISHNSIHFELNCSSFPLFIPFYIIYFILPYTLFSILNLYIIIITLWYHWLWFEQSREKQNWLKREKKNVVSSQEHWLADQIKFYRLKHFVWRERQNC